MANHAADVLLFDVVDPLQYSGAKIVRQRLEVRATVCLRKTDDVWLSTHEHQSVPFNRESGKASLDLKPDETN